MVKFYLPLLRKVSKIMGNTQKKDNSATFTRALKQLEIGESLSFPAARTSSIKTMSSQYGFEWGKKFRTSIDRMSGTIIVIRVK